MEEAFRQMGAFNQKHLVSLHESVLRYEGEILERQRGIEECKARIQAGSAMVFNESILKP